MTICYAQLSPAFLSAESAFLIRPRLQRPDHTGQEMGNVRRDSSRLEAESKLPSCSTHSIVQAEEFQAGDTRSRRQCRGQMDRVKRSNRLSGNRVSRTMNDVCAQSQDVPMRSRRVQMGAAIGRRGFLDLTQTHGRG